MKNTSQGKNIVLNDNNHLFLDHNNDLFITNGLFINSDNFESTVETSIASESQLNPSAHTFTMQTQFTPSTFENNDPTTDVTQYTEVDELANKAKGLAKEITKNGFKASKLGDEQIDELIFCDTQQDLKKLVIQNIKEILVSNIKDNKVFNSEKEMDEYKSINFIGSQADLLEEIDNYNFSLRKLECKLPRIREKIGIDSDIDLEKINISSDTIFYNEKPLNINPQRSKDEENDICSDLYEVNWLKNSLLKRYFEIVDFVVNKMNSAVYKQLIDDTKNKKIILNKINHLSFIKKSTIKEIVELSDLFKIINQGIEELKKINQREENISHQGMNQLIEENISYQGMNQLIKEDMSQRKIGQSIELPNPCLGGDDSKMDELQSIKNGYLCDNEFDQLMKNLLDNASSTQLSILLNACLDKKKQFTGNAYSYDNEFNQLMNTLLNNANSDQLSRLLNACLDKSQQFTGNAHSCDNEFDPSPLNNANSGQFTELLNPFTDGDVYEFSELKEKQSTENANSDQFTELLDPFTDGDAYETSALEEQFNGNSSSFLDHEN